ARHRRRHAPRAGRIPRRAAARGAWRQRWRAAGGGWRINGGKYWTSGADEAVREADAVIVASPGYHGAISGMIKNALDYIEDLRDAERPYLDGVPVGCVAVAYGWQATVSTLAGLRATVHALRGWPSPLGAAINASNRVFDENGECVDDQTRFQLETVARQVVAFAERQSPMGLAATGL
ncbi:NADPH-dependent FMN reductase, partial [Protofrankia symbiont of Coriaria ruscifolia]|uniref:NADPH-dependent FMN reductase n=1 Tax=Protofrankia symbiont of Coriaria ruscifolia TaxID=1306542 RepID=UPI001A94B8F2